MEGFLLGLANGTTCAVYCIPALLSFLLQEGKTAGRNFVILSQFMLGRFAGYLLFSILAWMLNLVFFQKADYKDLFFGATYLVLAIVLIFYSWAGKDSKCGLKLWNRYPAKIANIPQALFPLAIGFITGLNICPPFLLVFTRATATGSLWQSVLFFIMFFLGTSLYFIPVPFLGFLNRFQKLRVIGKILMTGMAIFYLVMGSALVIKGIAKVDIFGGKDIMN